MFILHLYKTWHKSFLFKGEMELLIILEHHSTIIVCCAEQQAVITLFDTDSDAGMNCRLA